MKKIIVVFTLLICCVYEAFAQDVIVMRSGKAVAAVVEVVGLDTIKYRLFAEPEGVIYEVLKSEVATIHYQSGRVETIDACVTSNEVLPLGLTPAADDIVPGMKYKQLKKIYNYREYVPGIVQSHSPVWCGVASFLVPGLGQMVAGSVGRGFAFLGGHVGCYVLMVAGTASEYPVLTLASALGVLALDICSIVDATRVAKVTNMYENDLYKKYSFDINMYPSVEYVCGTSGFQPVPGLTLALRF